MGRGRCRGPTLPPDRRVTLHEPDQGVTMSLVTIALVADIVVVTTRACSAKGAQEVSRPKNTMFRP